MIDNTHLESHLLSLSLAKQRLHNIETRINPNHPMAQVWIDQQRREIASIQAIIDLMSDPLPDITDDELMRELT